MGKKDKRIDAYIARAPEFARPILSHIRSAGEREKRMNWKYEQLAGKV